MIAVINEAFMVCEDCLMFIANGDLSGLDYHYSPAESRGRVRAIEAGVAEVGGVICAGESEKDEEFSRDPCECCGSILAGSRHHCVVLQDLETGD